MKTKILRVLAVTGLALSILSPFTRAGSPAMIGINISGGEFATSGPYPGALGTQYFYPGAADINMAKAYGAELIRVPFTWDRIQHDTEGVLDAALWGPDITALDAAVTALEARGMRIILDMHSYAGRSLTVGGVRTKYTIGAPQLPVSEFARVWRLLADHYKNRPSIWGYDLMNEPGGASSVTTSNWVSYCQAAVTAIREVDMNTPIILEGAPGWNHASAWLTTGAPLLAVVDPANNLIFSAHCYIDRDQSGQWSHGGSFDAELVGSGKPYADHASALNVGVDRVKPFVDWCVANNVRGLVGEYGSHSKVDEANWNIAFDRMLSYMVDNGNGLVSGTQWGGGAIADAPRIYPRTDNSPPSMVTAVLPSYFSGAGTNYWQTYVMYDDNIIISADYSFPYSFASTAPAATCTLNIGDTSTFFSGAKSAAFSYTIPSGGFAGGGLHIRGPLTAGAVGGVDISRAVAAGHVLSFYAKGTTGATPSITLGTTSNASGVDSGADTGTGNWISLASISPLTSSWQRYEIPLASLLNAQITGAQRIQRIRLNAAPANGIAYQVNFDRISIGVASTNVAPTVTIATSTGGTSFAVGQNMTLVSTATDANAGDTIDYVEFYANDEKIGIDDTAPYQWTTAMSVAGSYAMKAIAFDSHGIPGQSTPLTVTVTGVPSVPAGVVAVPGNARVLLNWNSTPGATSYDVKRATVSGGPYTTVSSPTINAFTDTGRTNNTTYYYVVSAVSSAGASANSSQVSAMPQAISLIKDDQDLSGVTFTGTWTSSTSTPGAQGGRYSTDGNTGATGGKKVSYVPTITVAGNYKVYARWTAGANRAPSVHFDVVHSGGTDYTLQNETLNNNTWMLLGTYYLNAGTASKVEIRNDGATNNVIADAVKFELY